MEAKSFLVWPLRQLAPWLGDIHPGCPVGDAVSREGETPGYQEKLVYEEVKGLTYSSPGGGFSQDQKVIELSGGSSSLVYAQAIEHPLCGPCTVDGGGWETEIQTSLSRSLPELHFLIGC